MTPRAMKTRKPIKKQQPTSPSLTSLFSSITKASSNSSGSNSTVTQESYARQQRNSRDGRSKTTPRQVQKLPIPQCTPQPTPPESPVEARPNVFAFMEDDEDSDEESHHSGPEDEDEEDSSEDEDQEASDEDDHEGHDENEEHEETYPSPDLSDSIPLPTNPQASAEMSHYPVTPRSRPVSGSFHSDSGISIRSSSPERDSPLQQRKQSTYRPPRLRQWDIDSSPESFYARPSRSVPQTATFAPPPNFLQQSLIPFQRSAPPAPRAEAKYQQSRPPASLAPALSATSRSTTSVRPIYRRFEGLTNTLLLQLQAELNRLESDLANLDATLSPAADSSDPKQRRTRHQALLPQQRDQLEWQRAELFGLLGAKLEQYHRVLTSYHALSRMDAPDKEHVEKLKALVGTDPNGGEFLARMEDLVIIAPSAPTEAPISRGLLQKGTDGICRDDRETALFTGGAVLMTILAFKFVPSLFARVVLGACVVAAMVACGMLPELERERWRKQVGIYAGAVVALAAIVG